MPLASCRPRGRTTIALAVGAALLLSFPTASAFAQSDDERARGHFDAGASYFDQRRYDLAVREFEEAFRLSDRPALLLNLSTTHERMDRFDRAVEYLEEYLRREPSTPQRRTLEARLEELRRRIASGEGSSGEGSSGEGPSSDGSGAGPSSAPSRPASPGSGPSGLLIGSIASLGAAAIFGGVAIGTGLVSNDRLAELQTQCTGACPPGLDSAIDEGETMALVSTVFTFAGIAAALAGATLLTLELVSGGAEEPTTRASLWGSPAGGGVRLDVAF